jgi:hypothetical protein
LFSIAIRQNRLAREQLTMALLAASKADDHAAAAADPPRRTPPGGALDRSVSGFSEVVEEAGARYVRRWMVSAVAGHPDLLALAVRVAAEARADVRGGGAEIATVVEIAP